VAKSILNEGPWINNGLSVV